MKHSDTYRFSLSWGFQTEDSILAGEFLNSLGNKKSRFLVKLIADYVRTLPEGADADGNIRIVLESSDAGQQLIEKVKALVLAELEGKVSLQSAAPPEFSNDDDTSISFMLEGLDKWSQE